MQSVYLDHAATTPVAPTVLEAMLPYFSQVHGNASSRSHAYGWAAAQAVDGARVQLAELLDVHPGELTFTSGSTEAINLALKGIAHRYRRRGRHIVTAATEHRAVLDSCAHLAAAGYEVTCLRPDAAGRIDPAAVATSLRDDTVLVALMWANNETGVLLDVAAVGEACAARDVLFFSDATQAVGKLEVHPREVGVHALALSAHKFYGPKGVGALWVSAAEPRVAVAEQQHGGGHEGGIRSGTLNVPGIVGLGAAAALAADEMHTSQRRLTRLRDRLEARLLRQLDAVLINGGGAPRLGHLSNFSPRFTEAEALLSSFQRQLALSTGSACSSADLEPSHVLLAMGLDPRDAKAAVRVSLGRDTTAEHVELAARLIVGGVRRLREASPTWELHLDGVLP